MVHSKGERIKRKHDDCQHGEAAQNHGGKRPFFRVWQTVATARPSPIGKTEDWQARDQAQRMADDPVRKTFEDGSTNGQIGNDCRQGSTHQRNNQADADVEPGDPFQRFFGPESDRYASHQQCSRSRLGDVDKSQRNGSRPPHAEQARRQQAGKTAGNKPRPPSVFGHDDQPSGQLCTRNPDHSNAAGEAREAYRQGRQGKKNEGNADRAGKEAGKAHFGIMNADG
jgi:hypothetical protein